MSGATTGIRPGTSLDGIQFGYADQMDGGPQMPGPRPGSNAYDVERARLRKFVENSGRAVDKDADATANRILREERGQRGFVRGERGLGPKGERAPGEPK